MKTGNDLDWADCPAVDQNPLRFSGAWVFRGSRISLMPLFEDLEDRVSLEEFTWLLSGVSVEQSRLVLEHVARSWLAAVA